MCKAQGITLLEIPYWWDQQLSTLQATIHHIRPDIHCESREHFKSEKGMDSLFALAMLATFAMLTFVTLD